MQILVLLSSNPLLSSLLLLSLIFTSILFLFRPLSSTKKPSLPPGPPKLPIIGNLHLLSSFPHRSFFFLSNKHGPIMLLQIGQVPTLIVSSSEIARHILKEQDHIFATRPSMNIPRALLYNGKDIAFAPYNEYWRQVRKIAVLHLLSHRRVQSYRTIREEEVKFMIDKVSSSSSMSSPTSINLTKILNSFAKDTILRVVMGKCTKEDMWRDEVGQLIEEASGLLSVFHWGDYIPWLAWMSGVSGLNARVRQIGRKMDELLESVIERHNCSNKVGGDTNATFIEILLSLEKEINCGFPFDKENIKAIIEDIVGAGTDSTYITMEWIMAELLRNPPIMAKLKTEITSIVGPNQQVSEHHLPQLSYLKAIIKESFRLHPTGPLLVPRESMQDTHINGYTIPKHTRVLINVWAIGRDPNLWECAEKFVPARFMGTEVDFKGQDYKLLPFGAGRRMCPGIQFAMNIVELGVANLVHQFEWELEGGLRAEDLNMDEASGLTCRKKVNLHVVATPCSKIG